VEVGRSVRAALLFTVILWGFSLLTGNVAAVLGSSTLAAFLVARYAAASFRFSTVAGSLTVERTVGKKVVKQDASIEVETRLRVRVPQGVVLQITDLPPVGARVSGGSCALEIHGPFEGEQTITYQMTVPTEGKVRFAGVKADMPDAFFPKSVTFAGESMQMPGFLVRPNRLFLTSRGGHEARGPEDRLLSSGSSGVVRSLRKFVDGDDYRNVDWKVTARHNMLYVKEYSAEVIAPPLILVDIPQVPVDAAMRSTFLETVQSAVATWMQEAGYVSLMIIKGPAVISFLPKDTDYAGVLRTIPASWGVQQETWFYRSRPISDLQRGAALLSRMAGNGGEESADARYLAALSTSYAAVLAGRRPSVFEEQIARALWRINPGRLDIFSCYAGDLSHLRVAAGIAEHQGIAVEIWTEKDQDRETVLDRIGTGKRGGVEAR
jgi:hypothetical protein